MALINLRNALMGGKRLPYDAEVEYLESTGTQWIDTGVAFSQLYTFKLCARLTPTVNERNLFGAYSQTVTNKMVCGCYNRFIFGFNPPGARIDSATLGTSELDVDIVYAFSSAGRTLTVNGTTYSATTGYTNGLNVTLFRANPAYEGVFKCYSFKIYDTDGTTLVRDYIPVRKGATGELYDRVSGKFAERHGDFVLGPDVVPVEYIESHGTEYIDTGIVPNDSTGIRISYSPTTLTSTNNVFGVYSTASNRAFRLTCSTATASTATCNFWWGPSFSASGQSPWYGRKTEFSLNFVNSRKAAVDGITVHDIEDELTAISHPLALLSNRVPSSYQSPASGRLYGCDISKGAETAMSLIPIRVGSGSTWEGAMMDVLTRRIYRNAGTGAFTYGNDLKYPIPAA